MLVNGHAATIVDGVATFVCHAYEFSRSGLAGDPVIRLLSFIGARVNRAFALPYCLELHPAVFLPPS